MNGPGKGSGAADTENMMTVPREFAAGIVAEYGDAGRIWIASLPERIDALRREWHLMRDGEPRHGHLGLVLPVRRDGERLALKVSFATEATAEEARALAAWGGRGAVRLIADRLEDNALLLEWLDPARQLASLPADRALPIAAALLRRLAITAPDGVPRQYDIATQLAEALPDRWRDAGQPFPAPLLRRAVDLARTMARPVNERLVHYDLHDDNILAGEREPWLAIDPKVIAGDPEYGVAQLLWRRLDEMSGPADLHRHLGAIIAAAALDAERTRAWTVVRALDYWLWGLSIGLTEDPRRCATLVAWLDAAS